MKKVKLTLVIFLFLNLANVLFAENNFFEEGKKKYNEKKYEASKFLFQKNIVFNPKDAKSYLFLAKIYNIEKNQKEEEKNINTTLLLDVKNEEAIFMLMEIELKKSNYSKVKELAKIFSKVCINLCAKKKLILNSLKNLEPKNES
tara:strand:+ start:280 stop:714 length:435 start_codon:yes stop_codon:yes gene_type:complete